MTEPHAGAAAPEPVTPDTQDWTWVLERPCAACGFDPAEVVPTSVPRIIVEASDRFALALEKADAGVRTTPGVWSTVEYGQHVADVLEVMTDRLRLILDGDHEGHEGAGASFDAWDQDAAAVEKEYWRANTHVTAILIKERAAAAAEAWGEPDADQWTWSGRRSDGVEFTAESLGRYLVHELLHHLHDVDA
ncbi:MAG: DinB family protein [Propionibacteriaceae bacterium]|nr:DinB family protein [Propionibacteriaceae bacterium]